MILEHMKRSIAAALCAVMVVSSPVASFGALAAENVSEGSDVVQENEPENSSEASSSHVV